MIRRKFILKSINTLKHKFLVILNKYRESRICESINDNYKSKEDLATVMEESFGGIYDSALYLSKQRSLEQSGHKPRYDSELCISKEQSLETVIE